MGRLADVSVFRASFSHVWAPTHGRYGGKDCENRWDKSGAQPREDTKPTTTRCSSLRHRPQRHPRLPPSISVGSAGWMDGMNEWTDGTGPVVWLVAGSAISGTFGRKSKHPQPQRQFRATPATSPGEDRGRSSKKVYECRQCACGRIRSAALVSGFRRRSVRTGQVAPCVPGSSTGSSEHDPSASPPKPASGSGCAGSRTAPMDAKREDSRGFDGIPPPRKARRIWRPLVKRKKTRDAHGAVIQKSTRTGFENHRCGWIRKHVKNDNFNFLFYYFKSSVLVLNNRFAIL